MDMKIRGLREEDTTIIEASALVWGQSSPHASLNVTAEWAAASGNGLQSQNIRFYSDSACSSPVSAWITLSASAQSYAWTAPGEGTFSFQIQGENSSGNTASSVCSSLLTVDVAPAAPSALSLSSPATSPGSVATPVLAVAGVVSGDTVRIFSDPSCSTQKGIAVASGTSVLVTSSAVPSGANVFYANATDAGGNTSACSLASVAYTYLLPATGLTWLENAPAPSTTINAAWDVSAAAIANQRLQFYSDATCTTPSGGLIDLASSSRNSYSFTGTSGGTYSFIVKSVDSTGASIDSACSGGLLILSGLRIAPKYLEYPVGAAISANFSATGGAGGYSYATTAGAGSVVAGTGAYTAATGTRSVGATTTVQVTDSASATSSATIRHARLAVDGTVYASVTDGTSLYIGGIFSRLNAPPAKALIEVDPATGASTSETLASGFNGSVSSIQIAGDTAYVGGTFSSYRGTAVGNLVKIDLPTGELDTTFTQATGFDSSVYSLHLSGNSLYVGGLYLTYRGDNRAHFLAKLDAKTGALDTAFNTTANVGPNQGVNALLVSGPWLYIGGDFTAYRGDGKAYRLARLNAKNGNLDTASFNTVANSGPNGAGVYSLALSGSSLFVGGWFNDYRGDARGAYLAKVDANTGALETSQFNNGSGVPSAGVFSMALSGSSLYIGGDFSSYRTDSRGSRVAKIDTTTGAMDTTFNSVASSISRTVHSVALLGSSLYVGGDFYSYRGDSRGYRLIKLNATTGAMDTAGFNTTSNVGPNAEVRALAASATRIYAGGGFSVYRGGVPAQNVAKLDIATGQVDTTFTQSTGASNDVFDLQLSGSSLYLAGSFQNYRGDSRGAYLAKVDTTTGALDTTFNSATGPGGPAYSVAVSGTSIYAGGIFTTYRGDNKGYRLVKLDSTTGVMDTAGFNTSASTGPSGNVNSIVVDGTSLFIGGDFTSYRADNKGYYLAKIDAATGALETASFNTTASSGPDGPVYTLLLDGTSLFVGGGYSTYRGDNRGYCLAKVDTTTGAMDTAAFNSVAGPQSTVASLAISGGYLYVGGSFSSYRGDTRGYNLAKVSTATGALETASFNTGYSVGPAFWVDSLTVSGTTLFAGGSYRHYRGDYSSRHLTFINTTTGAAK